MGLAKRRLYKPDRTPARTKGVIGTIGRNAPIALPDASRSEIVTAIYALGREAGVIIGRGADYDQLKDVYTVLGKSSETGRPQDFTVQGSAVADVICLARFLNRGPHGRQSRPAAGGAL